MNAPIVPNPDGSRSIGAILVDAGRLSLEDAERVLKLQREGGLRFGDAAKELKLLSEDDIQFALARQFDYPYLLPGESKVTREVVAAYDPFSAEVESLREIRSQLLLRWFGGEDERKTLAVVSPEGGEGRSWMAANLAVVFSQLGERTLLIDADMRRPRQHTLFGIDSSVGLSAVLSGRSGYEAIHRLTDLLNLSVLPAGVVPPNPQELLSRPAMSSLLAAAAQSFEVVIIDTPPASLTADAQMIAVRASGALMVARRDRSRAARIVSASAALTRAGALIVGSVVNEF